MTLRHTSSHIGLPLSIVHFLEEEGISLLFGSFRKTQRKRKYDRIKGFTRSNNNNNNNNNNNENNYKNLNSNKKNYIHTKLKYFVVTK